MLAVAEMVFAVMLVIAAGLVIQSLLKFQHQKPGFQADHLLTAHLYLPRSRYSNTTKINEFCRELQDRVQVLPGVQSAAIATQPGLPDITYSSNGWLQPFTFPGRVPEHAEEIPSVRFGMADSHYLRTTRIPLLQGRSFSDSDIGKLPRVALVNQAFVERYMPNINPVEKEVDIGIPGKLLGTAPTPDDQIPLKVVGVIGNVKNVGMARPPAPEITSFFYQYSDLEFNGGFKFLLVRTNVEPTALIPAIRNTLDHIDPEVPLALVRTVEDMMSLQAGDSRFNALLFGVFGAIGMLLAVVGVYGVTSYLVAQRTQEIAVRIALGAQQRAIFWLLIKQGIFIGTIGATLGMAGAFILRQGVAELVYGISPVDPATFTGAATLLVCFCILAVVVPVKRALRLSPVVALHEG